jgi:hypothetical protein
VPLYISGKPTQYGSIALNVGSQIDGLVGGLAAYAYDGDFSLGQFGAIQVDNFNDNLAVSRRKNALGTYDVYVIGNGQNVTTVGTAPSYDNPYAPITFNGPFEEFHSGMEVGVFSEAVQAPGFLAQILGASNGAPSYLAPATVNNGARLVFQAIWMPSNGRGLEVTTTASLPPLSKPQRAPTPYIPQTIPLLEPMRTLSAAF